MPNTPQRMRVGSDYSIDLSGQGYFQAIADAEDTGMDVGALAERLITAAEDYELGGDKPGTNPWDVFFQNNPLPAENMPFSAQDRETLARINLFRLLDSRLNYGITPQAHQIAPLERLGKKPTFAVGPNVADSPPREVGLPMGQTWGRRPPPTEEYWEIPTFGDALKAADAPFERDMMQKALEEALLKHFITPDYQPGLPARDLR